MVVPKLVINCWPAGLVQNWTCAACPFATGPEEEEGACTVIVAVGTLSPVAGFGGVGVGRGRGHARQRAHVVGRRQARNVHRQGRIGCDGGKLGQQGELLIARRRGAGDDKVGRIRGRVDLQLISLPAPDGSVSVTLSVGVLTVTLLSLTTCTRKPTCCPRRPWHCPPC